MGKCFGKISSNSTQKPLDVQGDQCARSFDDKCVIENMMSGPDGHLIRKELMLQEQETKVAEMPDVVSCPFCNVFTAMHKMEENVFSCLNPKCLMEFYCEDSIGDKS